MTSIGEWNVVEVLSPLHEIGPRIEAGKGPEVVDNRNFIIVPNETGVVKQMF